MELIRRHRYDRSYSGRKSSRRYGDSYGKLTRRIDAIGQVIYRALSCQPQAVPQNDAIWSVLRSPMGLWPQINAPLRLILQTPFVV